jgi:hypothetical protein
VVVGGHPPQLILQNLGIDLYYTPVQWYSKMPTAIEMD